MATIYQQWGAADADVRTTAFPQLTKVNGTNIPVASYAFDAGTDEAIFLDFDAVQYGSGDLTVELQWYAATATSGAVVWGAQIAAVTPNTDTTDAETDSLSTAATVTDSHLGTTARRRHRAVITLTGASLDSLAARDDVRLRIYRDADNGADTLAGNVHLERVTVSYSDT